MRYFALGIRPSINAVKKCCVGRAHHSATAELVRIGSGGITVTGKVGVWLGKPEEAYVMLPPETSHDLQAGSLLTGGCSLTKDLKTYPLSFYHDTRHFAHDSSPYPRLVISQDLPRQSAANKSPATLYTYGKAHTIALNGTPDAEFAKHLGESLRDLEPALDNLKDR